MAERDPKQIMAQGLGDGSGRGRCEGGEDGEEGQGQDRQGSSEKVTLSRKLDRSPGGVGGGHSGSRRSAAGQGGGRAIQGLQLGKGSGLCRQRGSPIGLGTCIDQASFAPGLQ